MEPQHLNQLDKPVLIDLLLKERQERDVIEREYSQLKQKTDRILEGLSSAKVGLFAWDLSTGYLHLEENISIVEDLDLLSSIGSIDDLISMVHPDDAHQLEVDTILKQHEKEPLRFLKSEFRVLLRKDKYIWMQAIGNISYDDKGSTSHLRGIYREVTYPKKKRLQLEKESSQLKMLTEMAQEGVLMYEDGKILNLNRAMTEITGYSKKELIGNDIADFLDAPTHAMLKDKIADKSYFQFSAKKKDGSEVHMEAIGKSLGDGRHFVIVNDISRRKEAEERLLKYQEELEAAVTERTAEIEAWNEAAVIREQSFSKLLDNLQSMAYRRQYDGEWTTTYISDGSLILTGYPSEAFMKGRVSVERDLLDRKYAYSVRKEINDKLKSKKSFKVTYPIITLSGERKWVLDRGMGIYDDNGKFLELVGISIDITEQKEKERELQLAKRTIDSAPVSISWIAKDGSYEYVNEQLIKDSGYTREDFMESKVYSLVPGLSKEEWEALFQERMLLGIKNEEVDYYTKDGGRFPALINASNIEYEGVVYNCAYINNITQMKKAETELQEAYDSLSASEAELRQQSETLALLNEGLESQKDVLQHTIDKLKQTQKQLVQAEKMASLGVMAAGIAHELNNPINYVSTGTEALDILLEDVLKVLRYCTAIEEGSAEVKIKEVKAYCSSIGIEGLLTDIDTIFSNINSGVEKATEIIKGLKTFSSIDRGLIESRDIGDIIEDALLILYNTYKLRIEIIKEFATIPNIECYPNKLSQVFVNIIGNAVQAIEDEGVITIMTRKVSRKEGDFVEIVIKDTGQGIPKEQLHRVFEPFYTTKEPGEGTGLGLSISLGIVEDHAGFVEIDSDEGKGTTFSICLPLYLSQWISPSDDGEPP